MSAEVFCCQLNSIREEVRLSSSFFWHLLFSILYSVTNPMKRTLTKGLLWAIEQGQKRKSVKYKILFTLMLPGLFVEQQTVFSGPPTTHLVKVFDNKKWCRACVNCYRYTQQEEHYHIKCLGWGSIFMAPSKGRFIYILDSSKSSSFTFWSSKLLNGYLNP